MALKVLVKAATNVVPTNFTLDLSALISANPDSSIYQHEGPFLWSAYTEVAHADTTAAGGAFDMHMRWLSPAGQLRSVDTTSMAFNSSLSCAVMGPVYMIRQAPGSQWEFQCSMINPGDSRITWQMSIVPLCFPDAISF